MDYEYFMQEAYGEAIKAYEINEVPIGCVIVHENKIISRAFNKRNLLKSSIAHAEILAISEACNKLQDWRLEDTTIFVTVEPCPMCAGAILQSRMERLVFATSNEKAGCCGSILNLLDDERFNHKTEVVSGILKDECTALMKKFFKNIRGGA